MASAGQVARIAIHILGISLFWISGIALFIIEVRWASKLGAGVAMYIPGAADLVPVVYMLKAGWSPLYVGLWCAGVAGLVITYLSRNRDND